MTDPAQPSDPTTVQWLATAQRQLAAIHGAVVDDTWPFERTTTELFRLGDTLLAARMQLQRDNGRR